MRFPMKLVATLTLEADVQNLEQMRAFVSEICSKFTSQKDLVDDLILALDEAVTNIIVHGYKGKPGKIQLALSTEIGRLCARLSDQSAPFDPTLAPDPDVTLPLEKRKPGGLGVYMMRQLTDQILYQRTSQGENQLTLIKHISGEET